MDVFSDEVLARERIGKRYSTLLKDVAVTPFVETYNTSVYAQYTIQVANREGVQRSLEVAGVPTVVHYPIPLNLQPAFSYLNQPAGSFPVSEAAARRVMSLPMHPYLGEQQQDEIVARVKEAIRSAS